MTTKSDEFDKKMLEFFKKKKIVPCSLIVKDEGKIEICFDGLENIPYDKIKFIEEKESNFIDTENFEKFYMYDGKIFSSEIAFLSEYNNLKIMREKYVESQKEKKTIVAVYKILSINVEQRDMKFHKDYLDKFNNIANENISNEEKAKLLDKLFKSVGLCIPKKIFIGGIYIKDVTKKEYKNFFDSNINSNYGSNFSITSLFFKNSQTFNKISKDKNTKIIGGDFTKEDFNDWKSSLNLDNSTIIEYANIIDAREILDFELQKKLKIPFELLLDKKKNREDVLKKIKNNNLEKNSGYKNLTIGICKEKIKSSEYPEIYKKNFIIKTPPAYFGYQTYNLKENFQDIIVGVNIIDNRNDDYNGEWTFKYNPLLLKDIDITFVSCFDRSQKYEVEVYCMKPVTLY